MDHSFSNLNPSIPLQFIILIVGMQLLMFFTLKCLRIFLNFLIKCIVVLDSQSKMITILKMVLKYFYFIDFIDYTVANDNLNAIVQFITAYNMSSNDLYIMGESYAVLFHFNFNYIIQGVYVPYLTQAIINYNA